MTQMERNADIVVMNCYAPMLVNVNPGARQWRPNLIGYDGLRVYGSPSYHAIKMFSTHDRRRDPEGDGDRHRRARLGHARQPVGTIYVKLVNATDADAPVQLDISGLSTLAPTATALTLAADPQATNSIDAPQAVAPVTSRVSGVKPGFTYTVPAHGIVVLTLEAR